MAGESSKSPAPYGPIRKCWQVVLIAIYLGVCLVHALCMPWLFLVPRFSRERIAFRLLSTPWAWYTTLLVRQRERVIGGGHLPRSWQGFLYVCNHESMVDIVVLTRHVRAAFLMKRSVMVSPVGWGGYLAGSIGFDRRSKQARARALEATLEMARRSMSMIVFPEGTFGHGDGRLRTPHLNLLRRAFALGMPVVPLGHAGTRRALDGQTSPLRPDADIVLVARPAVRPQEFGDADAFAAACWAQVIDAVRMARAEVAPGWPYAAAPG